MTARDREALLRLAGKSVGVRSSTDDLQGLLLQVSLALLMIFMIAYFIFVSAARKERAEQVLDLNRQKLVLALEKTSEDRRIRYGLNALMVQGTDGGRTFDAAAHFSGGRLALAPAAKEAFAAGSAAAFADYSDAPALAASWRSDVLDAAGLSPEDLQEEEAEWLAGEIARRMEDVRLDTRGVQRALAARLQRAIDPRELDGIEDANALAEAIKSKSLELMKKTIEAEPLP